MIFLDTVDTCEIRAWTQTGVVEGFTTNPSLLRQHAPPTEWASVMEQILVAVGSRPVSFEVTTTEIAPMISEAQQLARMAPNVIVKIPVHDAADPPRHLLDVVRQLADEGVAVNVTALMSAQQAYLASLAGARYVSIFAGRVADRGGVASAELRRARDLLDRQHHRCELIAASTRHPGNIVEWLLAGADIVTTKPTLLTAAIQDARTTQVVEQFMSDCRTESP